MSSTKSWVTDCGSARRPRARRLSKRLTAENPPTWGARLTGSLRLGGARLEGLDQRTRCSCRDPTIHQQSLPGDVAARLRRQEYHLRIQVFGLSGSLHRNAVTEIIHPLFVLIERLVLRRAKPTRRQAIDRDSVPAPIVGQAHRQLPDASPAGPVGPESGIASHAGHGTDVDDAPVLPRNHPTRDRLGNEEAAPQIGVENQVPIIPG